MNELLRSLGFSMTDGIMFGILIGQWLSMRARRDMGRRVGDTEKKIAAVDGARELAREIVAALVASRSNGQ